MRLRLALAAVLVLGGTGGLLTTPALAGQQAAEGGGPRVLASVQVTSNPDPARAHSSPQLALNPTNGELVIVETEVRGDFRCAVHISDDDGRSWFRGGNIHKDPQTECSRSALNGPYASLAFADDGVLYVAFMATDPDLAGAPTLPVHIHLARSDDGGRSFTTTTVVEAGEDAPRNARPMLAVDPNDSSKVYVSWMHRPSEGKSLAQVAASADGGKTFSAPVDLSLEQGGYQPRLAVGPDGTVHAIFPASSYHPDKRFDEVVRPLMYARSSDGGANWTEAVAIDPGNTSFFAMRKAMIAVDQTSGAIYAVWYGNPKTTIDPAVDDVDIFLRRSTDGGETWSEPVTVNDDADEPRHINHYDPGISVAPNGRVDIAWYDFRNSPYPERFPQGFVAPFNHDGYQDVYYTWSDDGGQTFQPNVRVTDRIINREIGVWSNNVHSHMSVGIASSNTGAYFAWQDTRNGDRELQAEDVYMAAVKHGGGATVAAAGTVPQWALISVGLSTLALGMGIAMLAAWLAARRGMIPAPARAERREERREG